MAYVIFDYGKVISHPPAAGEVTRMARAAGSDPAAFDAAYWAHRPGYDLGDLDAASYWHKVGGALGRSFSAAGVADLARRDVASWLHLNAGTLELAADVAAAGHRLCLLSNAPAELAAEVTRLPFAGTFTCCAFSCHLRLAKPDPAIFRSVLARLGARPAEAVLVDDLPENVASAAAVGLRAVQFSSPEQARAALACLGIIPRAPERGRRATGPGARRPAMPGAPGAAGP
jgi:putative hydrolase of the HAD superfamily